MILLEIALVHISVHRFLYERSFGWPRTNLPAIAKDSKQYILRCTLLARLLNSKDGVHRSSATSPVSQDLFFASSQEIRVVDPVKEPSRLPSPLNMHVFDLANDCVSKGTVEVFTI